MKKQILYTSVILVLVLIWSSGSLMAQIRGNGNVVKEKREVTSFNGVSVASGIDLILSQTGQTGVTIEADENLQEYIITEVKNGTLYVYVERNRNIWRATSLNAYVTVDDLSSVSISGGGDITAEGTLSSDDLKLAVSGGGDVDVTLNTGATTLSVSGGGDAEIDGRIKELKADLSGGGDIELNADLNALTLSVSGGGDAEIDSKSEISTAAITLSGGGDIEMDAPVKNIKLSVSGGGDAEIHGGDHADIARISVTGGGDLQLYLKTSTLNLYVSGGGDATLHGSSGHFTGEIKSGGDLHAGDYVMDDAVLELTGGSDARLNVQNDLKVKASGGGQVYLDGNPHIDANMTGGSKLHR